jgi:amino acid transporter
MDKSKRHKLNQWYATAICGNDILSTVFYVSGIAIIFSGVYAPLVLLIIGFVLFLYKAVYIEVVESLPLNGGAYNCMLNGTLKVIAALAGVITFLTCVATAVISGKVASEYLSTLIPGIPIFSMTLFLLFIFALLTILGIKFSAKVAIVIFIFHLLILSIFLMFGSLYSFTHGIDIFIANISHTTSLFAAKGGILKALFFGFSASLLGISGFESSANFIEEQKTGVFRKTLRNMLIGVLIFNPLITLIILNSLSYGVINSSRDFLLADTAKVLGGITLSHLVALDAVLVLSGAILASFIGVSGLLYRMAADGCLPNYFTTRSKQGSYPKIVIAFFLICSSILFLTKGNLLSLAGVYTISFLGVMSLFALGNLILKINRAELKRTHNTFLPLVVLALMATFFGIIGNILIDKFNLYYFLLYFIPTAILVLIIVHQDFLTRILLKATQGIPFINRLILRHFEDMTDGKFIVFIHHMGKLHRILNYISKNETGRNIILIHCADSDHPHNESYLEIKEALPILKKAGVYPHLNLSLHYKKEVFGPHLIREVAREFRVRPNRILIGSIHKDHLYDYDDLSGVRIIF